MLYIPVALALARPRPPLPPPLLAPSLMHPPPPRCRGSGHRRRFTEIRFIGAACAGALENMVIEALVFVF